METDNIKKIMLLGSGELGKEIVIAAKRIGLYVIACDRYKDAPAMQVADNYEVINMLDGDQLDSIVYKHKPDIIFAEIEAIRTEKLFEYEKQGIKIAPSAKAVNFTMNRKAIRDLAAKELNIKTAKYFYATTFGQLKEASKSIGFPCVIKPLMSSSGHGQSLVKREEDLNIAFKQAIEGSRGDVKEVIIEEFIHFDSEFTLLTITQKNGKTLFCPPIGHTQESGDYRESWQPFEISNDSLEKAQHMAKQITTALTGYGIWGVEFFLTSNGDVIFSELSPRPHDTGMVTLSGSINFNEFELHLYAALGLPISEIKLEKFGCSAVVLAKEDNNTPPNYNLFDAMKEKNTIVRIFGKPTQHINRRMGVVLCNDKIGYNMIDLRNKAKKLAHTIIK